MRWKGKAGTVSREVPGVGRSVRRQHGRQEQGTMQAQGQGWISELFLSFPARAGRCSSSTGLYSEYGRGRSAQCGVWVPLVHRVLLGMNLGALC